MGQMKAAWVVTSMTLIGLAVLFTIIGLDAADRVASTVGALTGVTGIGLSVVGLGRRKVAAQSEVAATVMSSQRPPAVESTDPRPGGAKNIATSYGSGPAIAGDKVKAKIEIHNYTGSGWKWLDRLAKKNTS